METLSDEVTRNSLLLTKLNNKIVDFRNVTAVAKVNIVSDKRHEGNMDINISNSPAKRVTGSRLKIVAFAALLAIFAAACSASSSGASGEAGPNGGIPISDSTAFDLPVTIISANSINDGETTLGELIDGDKPVLLWSFAAWCPNCAREAPSIDAFAAANPDVQVIGVGSLDSAQNSVGFIRNTGVQNSVMVWADDNGALWGELGFSGRTENLVVSPDLMERFDPNLGGFRQAEVEAQLTALA